MSIALLHRMLTGFIILILSFDGYGQNISWQREEPASPELELFHSPHAINLPTAETMQKGDFEFEISHRFIPPVSEGSQALFGFDGPANIRFGLGYAVSNLTVITLGRTNVSDSWELNVKYKAVQLDDFILPTLITIAGGGVWNTDVFDRSKGDSRNFQYYTQVIFNTLIENKLGIGFAPAYLYNSALYTEEIKYTITMGNYLQYYVSPNWSLLLEWIPTFAGWRDSYNTVSFGLEIETGGHFFKIIGTNNTVLNTSQYMAGSDRKFSAKNIRLGFMITRLL